MPISGAGGSDDVPMSAHVQQWLALRDSAHRDLEAQDEGEQPAPDPSHLSATLAGVASHKHHIASFVPTNDLLSEEPRQMNPYELRQPDKYARSQNEHGLLTLSGPHRKKPAANARRQEVDSVWKRNKNPKYGNRGPELGSLGLRPNPRTLLEQRMTRERFDEIGSIVPDEVVRTSSSGPAEHGLSLSAVRDDVLLTLAEVLAEDDLGAPAYPPRSGAEARLVTSSSYVERRAGRSCIMARQLIAQVGRTENITLEHNFPHPAITIHVTALAQVRDVKSVVKERIVEWLQAYFAGRASIAAADLGIPVGLQIRQSFGFLDTTVANTGESIRLSFGSEPPEYLEALAHAIKAFDGDVKLVAEAIRSPDPALPTGQGPWNTASEERKYAGVYEAIANPDGGVLGFLDWVTTGKAADLGDRDPDTLADDRTRGLAERRGAAAQALQERIDDARARLALAVPMTSLPVQADLDDTVILAAHLLESLDLSEPQAFDAVIRTTLQIMRAATQRALQILRAHPTTVEQRGHAHIQLRNATEDILDAAIVLADAASAHPGRDPLDEATERARTISGQQHAQLHFADSGSQALFAATLAHMPAQKASASVDYTARPDAYYELPRFREALRKPGSASTPVSLETVAPYRAIPRSIESSSSPAGEGAAASPGASDVLDATNVDMLGREFLESLSSSKGMAAASTVKLMQLGGDRHQQGLVLDSRPPDPSRQPVPRVPMSEGDRRFLAMLNDLRGANEIDLARYLGDGLDDPLQFQEFLFGDGPTPGPSSADPRQQRATSSASRRFPSGPSSGGSSGSFDGDGFSARDMQVARDASFADVVGGSGIGEYMEVHNASDRGNNCLIYSLAGAAGISVDDDLVRRAREAVGGGDAYLTTEDIPAVAGVLGIRRPVVVVSTSRSAFEGRFAAQSIGGGGSPLYLINAANQHFGWGRVRPEYDVQGEGAEGDTAIRFIAR